MAEKRIFGAGEVARDAAFDTGRGIHTNVVGTTQHLQLIWARYEPGSTYAPHSHAHDQFSVLLEGRMRLTVGDETREIGPGDVWHAPAHVVHGGELLGDGAVVFIDVYGPPSAGILDYVKRLAGRG